MEARLMRRAVRAGGATRWRSAPMRERNSSAARRPISSRRDMRLLITRPEPDATRTARTLRERGHQTLVAPLLSAQTLDADFAGPYGAVLMTSANAARAIATHRRSAELRELPVYTVGSRTADAAREVGFTNVESADGALADLVRLVTARLGGSHGPLLYFAGEDRAGELAGEL